MKKILALMRKFMDDKRYGKIIITFQAGKVSSFEMDITLDPKEFQDG
jgi:hypothetical protein